MGRQQKQFKQLSSSESLALAEQELIKGNWKEALNRALNCFKSIPGSEQRLLLERAYVARIRELAATGLTERALERFYELMQLDPQFPAVVAELPALRVRLGIGNETDQAPEGVGSFFRRRSLRSVPLLETESIFHAVRFTTVSNSERATGLRLAESCSGPCPVVDRS